MTNRNVVAEDAASPASSLIAASAVRAAGTTVTVSDTYVKQNYIGSMADFMKLSANNQAKALNCLLRIRYIAASVEPDNRNCNQGIHPAQRTVLCVTCK